MTNTDIALVDKILGERKSEIGDDLAGYRNHVLRMLSFCFALGDLNVVDREKVVIAGCFHDIGIWTANTFDYLSPSVDAARDFLESSGRGQWYGEITAMILQHHKIRRLSEKDMRLAEIFRKGDLVDLTLGLVKCGLSRKVVSEVRSAFPNEGFHKKLVRLAGRWVCRHPLDPVPVLRW